MDVNRELINAFIQLSNYFASKFSVEAESIKCLDELWNKHGKMIAKLMSCDTDVFDSANFFYEVLYKKMNAVMGSLATSLNPTTAASGDILEIAKFYVAHLEFLRNVNSSVLTNVLEKLTSEAGFDSSIILNMFAYFDKLYEENSVENWWEYIQNDESDQQQSQDPQTPRRSTLDARGFMTPTATARRLRTAATSARRSPIAEAVDSPTMKFLRSERELKQLKKKQLDVEMVNDELESANRDLEGKNREQRIMIEKLKEEALAKRNTAEDARIVAEELSLELQNKQKEVDTLSQHLQETRDILRTEQRNLSALEAEKEDLAAKLKSVSKDRDTCMRQLRDLRDANEHEFSKWLGKENDLMEKLRSSTAENAHFAEQLGNWESMKQNFQTEIDNLNRALEELNLVSCRNEQDADNSKTILNEERERFKNSMNKLQEDQASRIKMADSTIERLQKELDEERNDKKSLQTLLNDLNDKVLSDDKNSHEQSEGFLSIRACLETAKRRIEQLEIEKASKEATIAYQTQQVAQTCQMLITEKDIRENLLIQSTAKLSILENTVAEKEKEAQNLRENFENMLAKHSQEIKELKDQIDELEEAKSLLIDEKSSLQKECSNAVEAERKLRYQNELLSQDSFSERFNSAEKLLSFVEKDEYCASVTNGLSDKELTEMLETKPRKSVAFVCETENDQNVNTPLGFKNAPRPSICSLDGFDRASSSRVSIRSDTLTLASTYSMGEFKQPFTPTETSKDRVGVLTARNEKVKPHLQCSYATEMGEVSSPSADESNVKAKKKSRRDSNFFGFGRKNK